MPSRTGAAQTSTERRDERSRQHEPVGEFISLTGPQADNGFAEHLDQVGEVPMGLGGSSKSGHCASSHTGFWLWGSHIDRRVGYPG
jgi:hypothetical protein